LWNFSGNGEKRKGGASGSRFSSSSFFLLSTTFANLLFPLFWHESRQATSRGWRSRSESQQASKDVSIESSPSSFAIESSEERELTFPFLPFLPSSESGVSPFPASSPPRIYTNPLLFSRQAPIDAAALIAAKKAEIAAKLAAFKQKNVLPSSQPPRQQQQQQQLAPAPPSIPSRPTTSPAPSLLPSGLAPDLAARIAAAKARVQASTMARNSGGPPPSFLPPSQQVSTSTRKPEVCMYGECGEKTKRADLGGFLPRFPSLSPPGELVDLRSSS